MNYAFTDRNLASGKYNYRLKQIDYNGHFTYYYLDSEISIGTPNKFDLLQNYPNSFNPNTIISYHLAAPNFVTLKVFDNSGRVISTLVNDIREAGYYTLHFNGSNLASGIYFYQLEAGDFKQVKKMAILK